MLHPTRVDVFGDRNSQQALEPLAVALVERLMAGESSHPVVNAALLPVVGGVLLVSRDASLTWGGLFFAVAASASVGEWVTGVTVKLNRETFVKPPISHVCIRVCAISSSVAW